jgi:hypothetical protein
MIEIDWNPDRRKLRHFAVIWMVGFLIVGSILAFRHGIQPVSAIGPLSLAIMFAALVVGVLGLLAPPAVRPLYLVWMAVAFPIGWVLSHLLLAVVYYGVFTPIGLLLRLSGRDPLVLRDSGRESYWIERKRRSPASRYFRQF